MVSHLAANPAINGELRKILAANMDEAPARRRAREAFKDIQLGLDYIFFKTPTDGLEMKESYEVNSRGLEIFSKSWLPKTSSPKALVCYCHAYGETCTFFFEGIARKLTLSGYGVFAMDYPGFGLSEGLHGYIPSMDSLVDDVMEHYTKVKENPEFRTLPSFLFGQSMGGAIALKIHFKQPNAWSGAILHCPLCKMTKDLVPPWIITQALVGLSKFLPTQKLVPQKDLAEASYRDSKKRAMAIEYNVVSYKDKPRLRTGLELLRASQEIQRRMEEVSLPLLILNGDSDTQTDPSGAKDLYERARSLDKTFKLYKGGYHYLLEGEPDEVVMQVFNDTMSWLEERSHGNNTRSGNYEPNLII